MARQKRTPATHELIKQMMAMYQPETMEDVHDMLKDMFSDTLEEMLHAELDSALGYEKHDQSPKQTTNRRNVYAATKTATARENNRTLPLK